jgi:protein-tyrosine phosphatase
MSVADPSVLFVCLGNICRSPLAEAAFRLALAEAGLDLHVDSAGTGDWHAGSPPDKRAQAVAQRNGANIARYRARQVKQSDFTRFTHIVAMDADNLAALQAMRENNATNLSLLLDHVPGREGQSVADPYYGRAAGFDTTWADVSTGAALLLRALQSPQSSAI